MTTTQQIGRIMRNHWTRTIGAAIAGLSLSLIGATAAHADVHAPCPTEDSAGPCHWDAQHQGNGKGTSFTVYAHHRTVTGTLALTLHQVRNVERIVHRLPVCKQDQPEGCRVFSGHRRTLAVFAADGHTYFVRLHRGQLAHVEVYSR